MRSNHVLRFAVTDGVHRGASWGIVTKQGSGHSDVYVLNLEVGHKLKVSLHESGDWHTAFDEMFLKEHTKPGDFDTRFVDKWTSKEQAPGIRIALRIVTPRSAVCIPVTPKDKPIVPVPMPSTGKATEMRVLIAKPNVIFHPPAHVTDIGSLTLDSGDVLRIFSVEVDVPGRTLTMNRNRYFDGATENSVRGPGLRAMLIGYAEDGSRVLWDTVANRDDERAKTVC